VGWFLAVFDLLDLLRFVGVEQTRSARFDGDYAAMLLMGPGLVNGESRQRKTDKNDDDFQVEHDGSFVVN
jgi:uncharacterized heparinase superfamily protein